MAVNKETYDLYVKIMEEELIPALGCTEPIAVAYAAAKAREVLGKEPKNIDVRASGNIIKNVKGVIVPGTGDLCGIKTAAILGCIAGNASAKLEVLTTITKEDVEKTRKLLTTDFCKEGVLDSKANLHIVVKAFADNDEVEVEILHAHTNISSIKKNGQVIFEGVKDEANFNSSLTDRSVLNMKDIYEFATTYDTKDLEKLLTTQIEYNLAIAQEGLTNDYGVNVGKTLLETYGNDIKTVARAYAAAGSDARMSGCSYPVVINSGSGNQGMTVSLPVIKYAEYLKVSKEKLYRALTLANLIAIHQKTGIGRLSAFCGAVNAAAGAGAAITYLYDGTFEEISNTVINTLTNVGGIVCDGAKPSCAAKISSALEAAILAHKLAMKNKRFNDGEGLAKADVEATINSVCKMGREGMAATDRKILEIMVED